jgi:hypothetical protein
VAVALGDQVFIIGGEADMGVALGTMATATVGSDGAVGPITSSSTLLVAPRGRATLATVGDYVYLIGGCSADCANNVAVPGVERGSLNGSGEIGAFSFDTNILVQARRSAGCVVSGDSLYLLGGRGDLDMPLATIERVAVGPDGTLSTPVAAGSLLAPRAGAAMAVVGQTVYVIGGQDATAAFLTTIESAPINPDGTLGTFAAAGNLATPRGSAAAAVTGPLLSVIGGFNPTILASIEQAPLSGGKLGAPAVVAPMMAEARDGQASAVLGDFLYQLSGNGMSGTLTTIESAPIDPDGTLGMFNAIGMTTNPRFVPSHAVIGSWLYLIGGDPMGTTERFAIAPDGTIGATMPVASANLNLLRSRACSLVSGDQVCIYGGSNGVLYYNSIECAKLK